MSTPTTNATPFSVTTDATHLGVLTLEPNQGPMVILDRPLIERLEATLTSLPAGLKGLVLASGSSRVFVAGADLKAIMAMDHAELESYLAFGQRVFGLLCKLPFPTVAAINGAVLGGGLELAMHCDALVAANPPAKEGQPGRPYPVGLPEAGLAICPGWGGTNLLPARMDPVDAIRRTCAGQTMLVGEARAAGLFDAFAEDAAGLIDTAKNWLRTHADAHIGRTDGQPLRWIGRPDRREGARVAVDVADVGSRTDEGTACLKAVRAGLETGWAEALKVEREELNRLRGEPAGREKIAAFFNRK
jgi:enoyl-CoA hydratase/carnithine racemase